MNLFQRALAYRPVDAANLRFASAQSETCEAIWSAETKFDLIFREDFGVCLWPSYRMRHYYDIIDKRGVYKLANQKTHQVAVSSTEGVDDAARAFLADLPRIDAFIMTSATWKAAENRKHEYGCIYLKDHCKALLEDGQRVLLVTNAPEIVVDHENLFCLRVNELQSVIRLINKEFAPVRHPTFETPNEGFWNEVSDHFNSVLGVDLLLGESMQPLLRSWYSQFNAYSYLFDRLKPKISLTINHYGRAPLIQAAKDRGITNIEFQHGNIGRYHLGYSFPNLRKHARRIPYFPDEFWSWGEFWTDPDWFPSRACRVKVVGHHSLRGGQVGQNGGAGRSDILVISTWALQELYIRAAEAIARKLPDRKVIFKCHPMERDEEPRQRLENFRNVDVVSGENQLDAFFHRAEYAVSCSSTGLFEAIKAGCAPVILHGASVEYMIDFCEKFRLPMLSPDASNLGECMEMALNDRNAMQAVIEDYDGGRLKSAILSAVRTQADRRTADVQAREPAGRRASGTKKAIRTVGAGSKGKRSGIAMKKGRGIHAKIARFPPIAILLRRLVRSDLIMELLIKESCKDPDRLEHLVSLIMQRKRTRNELLNNQRLMRLQIDHWSGAGDKVAHFAKRSMKSKNMRSAIKTMIPKYGDMASELLVSLAVIGRNQYSIDDTLTLLELALCFDPNNREAFIKCLAWTLPDGDIERAQGIAERFSSVNPELVRVVQFMLAGRASQDSTALVEGIEVGARALDGHPWLQSEFHFRMLELTIAEGAFEQAQQAAINLIETNQHSRHRLNSIFSLVRALHYRCDRRAANAIFDAVIRTLLQTTSRRDLLGPFFEPACLLGRQDELFAAIGLSLPNDTPHWRQGLTFLKQLTPSASEAAFPIEAANALEWLADQAARTYLNVRVDLREEEEFVGSLLERIRGGKPCSMIRLGDAEAFGFETDRVREDVLASDRERRAQAWWGHAVEDQEVYRDTASAFLEAAIDADFLGVPNIFRLLRDIDLNESKDSLDDVSISTRSLVIILDNLKRYTQEKRLRIESKILVDERCHERLFSPDRTREFIKAAKRSIVISCHSQQAIADGIGLPIDAHIEIPPHNRIRTRFGLGDVSAPSMLQEFPRLLEEVESRVQPGDLVLVAAGFLGKILIHAAKKKGGVVLDCGAAADYWVGMKTRHSSDFIWT